MTQEFDILPDEWKAALARGETVSLRKSGKITARIVPEYSGDYRLDNEAIKKRLDAWQRFQSQFSRMVDHHIDASRESIYAEGVDPE